MTDEPRYLVLSDLQHAFPPPGHVFTYEDVAEECNMPYFTVVRFARADGVTDRMDQKEFESFVERLKTGEDSSALCNDVTWNMTVWDL